jgi:UDP-N-acetylmuramate--alanine ligase
VIICGLYAAGQAPIEGISGRTVFDAVSEARPGGEQYYCETRAELATLVTNLVRAGDLVLTMNAGDLTTFPDEMLASPWAISGSKAP